MDGIRLNKYSEGLKRAKESLAEFPDITKVAIVHEILDDTPYKTLNYMRYKHDEYYIVHNKPELINKSTKFYQLSTECEQSKDIINLIKYRYSNRDYTNEPISFEVFSQIIHYSMGVKYIAEGAYDQKKYPFKYSNNQGGLNYLDLYLVVNNVEGVEKGLYYYDFVNDRICLLDSGNMRGILADINFQNEFSVYSGFVAIVVADLSRVVPKYYKRAYRFAHVDAGILLAYLQLLAENNGLTSCIIAGFLEHKLEDLIGLTEDDYPIATVSIGKKCN